MNPCAVLHVTSIPGGGVDRHIRDIARTVARHHLIWHTADTADVIEIPRARRFLPIDRAAFEREPSILARWLQAEGVGLVHAHSVNRATRARASWAAHALGAPAVVTLHDVLFLRREGFEPGASREPDPAWLAETSAYLREAAAVLTPSEYLAGVARGHVQGLEVAVVPNGSPTRRPSVPCAPRPEFAERARGRVVAVVGAIGPHKGARVLEEVARGLAGSDITLVVVGYMDTQILHGWHGDHLYVHGAFNDEEVAALLAGYGAELALFPNTVPESFSFTLSDVWAAGLPAVVPPDGALGERVRRHGAGWLLPEGFGAAEVESILRRLLSPQGAEELARVKSRLSQPDPGRVPTLDAMSRSLEALYARYGIDPRAPVDPESAPVQKLLATNLDGALFRPEMVRLAEALSDDQVYVQAQKFETEARAWIAKLEKDVEDLSAELAREVQLRRAFGEENERMRRSLIGRLRLLAYRAWKKIFDVRS
jgi:glycosyltransferase involved in cell wall biosynthesis